MVLKLRIQYGSNMETWENLALKPTIGNLAFEREKNAWKKDFWNFILVLQELLFR